MIKVSKKHVYEANTLENYFGMMPLDVYLTLVYFNHHHQEGDHKNCMVGLYDFAEFLTACLVEIATTSQAKELVDFEFSANNFYFSGIPTLSSDTTSRCIVFVKGKKKIIVSETRLNNVDSLKMVDISREDLLKLVLSCNRLSMTIIDDVIKRCSESKKIAHVKLADCDENCNHGKEEEVKEEPRNNVSKFDMKNYQRL